MIKTQVNQISYSNKDSTRSEMFFKSTGQFNFAKYIGKYIRCFPAIAKLQNYT